MPADERVKLERIDSVLRLATQRLALLLGNDHQLVSACSTAQVAVWDVVHIEDCGHQAFLQADRALGTVMVARDTFVDTARKTFGAVRP
jgi:hypothetical protein